ncbi:hypothetical protein LY78DRAFT_33420 [Colletotrichum sublineola]|nr:hypothetical protein LY78DRAFT_33420 [Colletotrichum sublineola]
MLRVPWDDTTILDKRHTHTHTNTRPFLYLFGSIPQSAAPRTQRPLPPLALQRQDIPAKRTKGQDQPSRQSKSPAFSPAPRFPRKNHTKRGLAGPGWQTPPPRKGRGTAPDAALFYCGGANQTQNKTGGYRGWRQTTRRWERSMATRGSEREREKGTLRKPDLIQDQGVAAAPHLD